MQARFVSWWYVPGGMRLADLSEPVDSSHPFFLSHPRLWIQWIADGKLEPVDRREAQVLEPAENMMQRRPRGRPRKIRTGP